MKNPKPFKELQKEWYEKLKEDGFKDIEVPDSPREMLKEWDSVYFHLRHDPLTFQNKQEYFRLAGEFLMKNKFVSLDERKVWELHADGMSLREITKSIVKISDEIKNVNSVYSIVKRLKGKMLKR